MYLTDNPRLQASFSHIPLPLFLAWEDEIRKNRELFYVYKQLGRKDVFKTDAWDKIKPKLKPPLPSEIERYIEKLTEYNQRVREWQHYEKWYRSDVANQTRETAQVLHDKGEMADSHFVLLETAIQEAWPVKSDKPPAPFLQTAFNLSEGQWQHLRFWFCIVLLVELGMLGFNQQIAWFYFFLAFLFLRPIVLKVLRLTSVTIKVSSVYDGVSALLALLYGSLALQLLESPWRFILILTSSLIFIPQCVEIFYRNRAN